MDPGPQSTPPADRPDLSRPPTPLRELLTEYLRNRNVPCPSCSYNLCNVTNCICPECGTELFFHIHPSRTGGEKKLALGMFGIIAGLVLSMLAFLVGLHRGLATALPAVFLFAAGVVQLSLWEKYFRRIRARRRDLLWIYVASGWAIPFIILLWLFLPR